MLQDVGEVISLVVYRPGTREEKCSTTIGVATSTGDAAASDGTDVVGERGCTGTVPQNGACALKAHPFGSTCQIELVISAEDGPARAVPDSGRARLPTLRSSSE